MKSDVKIVTWVVGNPDSEEKATVEITKLIDGKYGVLVGATQVKEYMTIAFVKNVAETTQPSPLSGNLGS
jgi:hypothetical protein